MKRLVILLGLLVLSGLLAACSSSSSDGDDEVLPLEVQFFVASPSEGVAPLRTTLTTVITGGKAPFFYAWDFTNDGSPDFFDNGQFSRTASVVQDYFLLDPAGVENSEYTASLTVTDSEGTVWPPVTEEETTPITVLAQGGLSGAASWTSDSTDGQAHSGEPIFFSVVAMGGEAPYTYAWDFDEDGGSDSNLPNPQHTFFYGGPGTSKEFVVGVTITDRNGQVFKTRDNFGEYLNTSNVIRLVVVTPEYVTVVDPGFEITLSSAPSSDPGDPFEVIHIKFDPTQAEAGPIPIEPELDLSVVVDPFEGGGVHPFEYYWDFDNDGAIESQAASPSVPFYDFRRKILVNTYTHNLDSKEFTLRCMVIDGTGRVENAYRTVIVQNLSNSVDLLVVPEYGVDLGSGATPLPYGQVVDGPDAGQDLRDELTEVIFNFSISGSTGEYDFQFDANGDGVPEIPAAGGFQLVSGNQISISSLNADELDPFLGIGYFPAQIMVRSLQSGSAVQTVRLEVPVSLVGRKAVNAEGDLEKRFGHSVEGSWTVAAGGGNTQHLINREMVIVGGAVGNTPIRSVEKVMEDFSQNNSPPAVEGEVETSDSLVASNRIPIQHPRKGAMLWTDGTNYYIHAGEGENGEVIPFVEAISINDNDGQDPWTSLGDLAGFYPLKYGMATKVTDLSTDILPYGRGATPGSVFDALMFCGGVYQQDKFTTAGVSGLTFFYRARPVWDPVDADPMVPPNFDSYETAGTLMMTARHEGSLVWNPDDRLLYAIGGRTAGGLSTATVEVFDVDTKLWLNRPPMNSPRAGGVAKYIGGQIYIMGGSYYPENEGAQVVLTTAEVYDPETRVWSETLPPSTATHQPGAVALPGPGSVSSAGVNMNTLWYFGGTTDTGETNVFEEFVYFYDLALPDPT